MSLLSLSLYLSLSLSLQRPQLLSSVEKLIKERERAKTEEEAAVQRKLKAVRAAAATPTVAKGQSMMRTLSSSTSLHSIHRPSSR